MVLTMRFDGTTVIPIFVSTPGYREWELTLDGEDFSIVNEQGEDGEWTLQQWQPEARCWQDIARGLEVNTFLRTHELMLGCG